MTDILCDDFKSYVNKAENIFDIMAAAYKTLRPFESRLSMESRDTALEDIVSCFSEQQNTIQAFMDLKEDLIDWINKKRVIERSIIRANLFSLIRLIDNKCVQARESSLPDPYIHYFSLNGLFQSEISIVPISDSMAINLLSMAMSSKDEYGFYNKNYDETAFISGYLHNFVILEKGLIRPRINVPNYYKEITNEFEQRNYKLKVGIFPLSNVNLRKIFFIKEEIGDKEGVFSIESCDAEQEELLLERCKEALKICRNQCVDIAVFPEMLLTKKNQDKIKDFIKNNQEEENRFPWFIWLGTMWAERENKCMVIDQYGTVVFEQKKYVPYEYKRKSETIDISKVRFREDLSHVEDWNVNYLDIPGFLRIATAICRDISSDLLKDSLKKLHSDMVIIPAFSETDRLTKRYIHPLAMEKMIVMACNACSARCEESQDKFVVDEQMVRKKEKHIFCGLCMPAKGRNDNRADDHKARYISTCINCEYCNGYIWEMFFSECIIKSGMYSAKVTSCNF